MAESVTEFLDLLEKVKGVKHAQSVVAAEFALANQQNVERDSLRDALDAAAVLHWFDERLLAQILDITQTRASTLIDALAALPFVERYRSGEQELRNIHESTRLGWRKQLASERVERFRDLSLRAAACFADDFVAAGRIEWIYHLLCGNPEEGATQLERLDREWSSKAHQEERYALATALGELKQTGLLEGRARVWVSIVITWARRARGGTAQLADVARNILRLAETMSDPRAKAEAQCLLGDALQAQGKLQEAQTEFEKYLMINQQLAELDPKNADWKRELGVSHSRVGGVFEALGKLQEAQTEFEKALTINQQLAELDPKNAGWQRELAVAHSRVGAVFEAQGELREAEVEFREFLAITRKLVEQDPSDASLRQALETAQSRVERVLKTQTPPAEAENLGLN